MKKLMKSLLILSMSVLCASTASASVIPSTHAHVEMLAHPQEAKTQFTISFAGDCTLGEYKGQSAGGQFKDYFNTNGPDYFFEKVKSVFDHDDLTLINLEGPLTDHPQTENKTYPIRGDLRNCACLVNSGIDVCNLSNNHIFDCGQAGFDDTRAVLDANHIAYCGEGTQAIKIVRLSTSAAKVGFLGYQVWSEDVIKRMQSEISALKSQCDIVIVSCHGGTEGTHASTSRQETVYHAAVDAGADMVIGTHPHVLQGIEKYHNKVIAYSLGNFCFGANKNPQDKETCILQQTFRLDPASNQIVPGETTVIPCRISSHTGYNDFQPEPLTGTEEGNRILSNLASYSAKYAAGIF